MRGSRNAAAHILAVSDAMWFTRVESIEAMLRNGDGPGAKAGLEGMLLLLKTRTA